MSIPIYQVDAFTVQPFKGNPAAVCLLEKPRDAAWMQALATEMNLSETAFLIPKGDDYQLRWFTPTTEVDLCGHGTLSSAHILFEFGFYDPDEVIKFHTRSGLLTASFSNGTIELDMPRLSYEKVDPSSDLIDALGLVPVASAISDNKLILAEFDSAEEVENFVPDMKKLTKLEQADIIITAPCVTSKYDFVSRFFAPSYGIPEDPVTGMAHCVLGPYYMEKLGKEKFFARQASKRGGDLWVRVASDRVFLGGKAVTVFRGELQHQKD